MTPTALMSASSAPRCLSPAWEQAMRRLHRSCLTHSSVAIFEMFGSFGPIHNQTTPVGAQAMAGGFLTLINAFVSVYGVVPGLSANEKRSEEHTSELQSHLNLVCRLLLEKKKQRHKHTVAAIINTSTLNHPPNTPPPTTYTTT